MISKASDAYGTNLRHHLAVLSFATPEIAAQCKEPHVVDTLEFSRLDLAGPRNRYIYCAATIARKLRRRFELWFSGSTHR